jgi:hypothetical protein
VIQLIPAILDTFKVLEIAEAVKRCNNHVIVGEFKFLLCGRLIRGILHLLGKSKGGRI